MAAKLAVSVLGVALASAVPLGCSSGTPTTGSDKGSSGASGSGAFGAAGTAAGGASAAGAAGLGGSGGSPLTAGGSSGGVGTPPDIFPPVTPQTMPLRSGSDFASWGNETLDMIERDFRLPSSDNYREALGANGISFNWSTGVQLAALIASGRTPQAETYAAAVNSAYWCNTKGRWGYNSSANGCGDRYYDDNAWIAKDLLELYAATHNSSYLDRAKETVAFSMSGENPTTVAPYGGIRWHEGDTGEQQCVCATAPTIVANLMIYRATQIQSYLTDGLRLYSWVKANAFGYGPGHRGYENAVITQAATLLWQITGDNTYLNDAHHQAYAMESTYVDWETHALRETGQWGGHDMTNAYVDLYNADGDVNWLNIAAGYLEFLHAKCKDPNGHYPEGWFDPTAPASTALLQNAAAARAFAKMGTTRGGATKPKDPVALFQDCDYQGIWRAGLPIGKYLKSDLEFRGLAAKDLSSLRVQSGYQVTLYKDDNFQGDSLVKTADDSCLAAEGWNDIASSLVVEAVKPLSVVYKDCNFTGPSVELDVGSYDEDKLRALGISPQSISSLQVASGYEVLLYSGGHFENAPYSSGTASCLANAGWNDKAASIVVTSAGAIHILDATYGPNCESPNGSATEGNHTSALTAACDGLPAPCLFPPAGNIQGVTDDPSIGCQKDWVAHYTCYGGATKTLTLCGAPGAVTCEAGGLNTVLTCP